MAGERRRSARAEVLGLEDDREPPCNIELEQALLGTLLMQNATYAKVSQFLKREHFFEDLHGRIYEIAAGLIADGKVASPITVKTFLGDHDLGGMTTSQYMARLAAEATTVANAVDYARSVYDLALRRQMIAVCTEIVSQAFDTPVSASVKGMVDAAVERLAALQPSTDQLSDFEDFDGASYRAIMTAQQAYQRNGALVGLSTGLHNLDDALGGLQPTDLLILAGRPGMGKTSLATNIAFAVAQSLQQRKAAGEKVGVVGFASLEMSSEQLSQRIISEQSRVPGWKLRRGRASEDEMEAIVAAQRQLKALPLMIDPTAGLNIATLRMRARNLQKRFGLELLIVDYLQLLQGSGTRGNNYNRVQEVTEITTGLKELAKELKIPVIALSQMSRKAEERPDRRPMLSDLRESGSIEQDADVVMFVYREEYYLSKETVPQQGTEARLNYDRAMRKAKGVAEVLIAKNRHGPETSVVLGFDGNVTTFLNEPEEREPEPDGNRPAKKKPVALPKEATILYGVLKSLTLVAGEAPSPEHLAADRNLKRKARIVPFERVVEAFARESLGPDADMGEAAEKLTKTAMKALRAKDLAFYTGTHELGGYIWLPELVDDGR